MKKHHIVLFALFLLVASFTYGQEKQHNNIIIFDNTGSMVGRPPPYESINRDIWKPSLRLLEKQLNSFPKEEKNNNLFIW